ncbi:helix-turn-helix domain-containing protein [Rhodococcus sp. NPDC079359]|uniref:helix-turn-helix domain-containing protein n=1 Tax=Rhodococcus sp. NPDC079359 TaxID=3154961 RepID=UPI00344CD8B2
MTTRGMCHACYEKFRLRQKAYGRFESEYIDAAPARAHVEALLSTGLGARRIAELAGVERKTIRCLILGRPDRGTGPNKAVRRLTADRILSIALPTNAWRTAAPGTRVASTGTVRRLRALVAIGWTQEMVAAEIGIHPTGITRLTAGQATHCTARRAREVAEIFARRHMQVGPSEISRKRARQKGWALPFEWDEDVMDDPDAEPAREVRWTRRSSQAERAEQIQQLTVRGLSAREIADRVGISRRQVTRDRGIEVAS